MLNSHEFLNGCVLFRASSKFFLLLFFLSVYSICTADELELHLTSYHFNEDSDDNFNEFNIGAGYNYEMSSKIFASVGVFNNSYEKLSIYVAAKWLPLEYKFIKAGLVTGFVTGYDEDTDANENQPAIIPEIQFHYEQYYLVSRFAPDLGDNSSSAITLSIGYKFQR